MNKLTRKRDRPGTDGKVAFQFARELLALALVISAAASLAVVTGQ